MVSNASLTQHKKEKPLSMPGIKPQSPVLTELSLYSACYSVQISIGLPAILRCFTVFLSLCTRIPENNFQRAQNSLVPTAYIFTISDQFTTSFEYKGKKSKVVPLCSIQAHLGEMRYSSYSFLTSALEGGEWSASRPSHTLPPGKELPVPTV
jgi:hypothetical protein